MTSKEEYLKKYLCGGSNESKKKKRSDQSRVKIYDDDIDVKSLLPKNIKNTLDEDIGDDKPSVADVVDERPRDVVELEKFRQSKHWKIVGSSDSKGNDGNRTATTTQNSASRGSVASPLRDKGSGSNDVSNKHRRHDSDSDVSPPRKRSLSPKVASLSTSRASSKYVSSPVSDRANPPRQISRHDSPLQQRHRHDSESSDLSPQRTTSCDGYVPKRSRHDSDSDSSDRKKRRHDSDSDNSPARRSRPVVDSQRLSNQGTGDDVALLKQNNRHNSDSDSSPKRSSKMRSVPDSHLAKKGVVSDFDLSPSRQNIIRENPRSRKDVQATNRLSRPEIVPKVIMSDRRDNKSHTSTRQSTRDVDASDTDLSPRRRQRHHDSSPHRPKRLLDDDDGDLSPVRKSDSDKLSNSYKASKTLSGATAGLQSAEDMKREARELKRKEEESFSRLPDEILGKNAAAVIRGRQLAKQSKQAEEKAAKDAAAEKYKVWNQGVKQQELRAQQVEDAIHESEKPLSRYRDDVDLDAKLREQDRAGDPMLAYIKKKKIKSQEPAKPRYTGPEPPPNRFNIWPGYRWDGVDRSNGFERQYFASLSNKKAIKDISYKWSVEDM